jgi:predicted N-acetyltransferase YhbS
MTIEIRQAKESDIPAIVDLYRQPDMSGKSFSLEKMRLLFQAMSNNPYHNLFVACLEDEVVGSFAIIIIPVFSHEDQYVGLLEDVVVRTDQQGQGIGKKMMLFAKSKCKQSGCYKVMLSSGLHREKAHKFYEGLGFKKHGYSFQL